MVKCEYCGNKTSIGNVENHLKKCKIMSVPCPNKCGKKKSKQVKRMYLSHHLKEECPNRQYECKLCGETGTFQNLGQTHEQNCLKRKVNCPNTGCGKIMEYHLLTDHIANECDHTLIPCKICGAQVKRKNLDEHEQGDTHHATHLKTWDRITTLSDLIVQTSTVAHENYAKQSEEVTKLTRELSVKLTEYGVKQREVNMKHSEDIAKLKREVNLFRLSLIIAGVICILLLGTVIVVLNLRTSNETDTVKEFVLSLQANVSALQEAHIDTMAKEKVASPKKKAPEEKVASPKKKAPEEKVAAPKEKVASPKQKAPKEKVAAPKEKVASPKQKAPKEKVAAPKEKVASPKKKAMKEKIAAPKEKVDVPKTLKQQTVAAIAPKLFMEMTATAWIGLVIIACCICGVIGVVVDEAEKHRQRRELGFNRFLR